MMYALFVIISLGNNNYTMSSREIAELTGKRHDSVKRTIEILSQATDKRPAVIKLHHCEEAETFTQCGS